MRDRARFKPRRGIYVRLFVPITRRRKTPRAAHFRPSERYFACAVDGVAERG